MNTGNRLISIKQQEAARKKGGKSKGPVTPEGKAASSQNARKHGLLAYIFHATSPEDSEALNLIHDEYIFRFDPREQVQCDPIEEVVFCNGRSARLGCTNFAPSTSKWISMRTKSEPQPSAGVQPCGELRTPRASRRSGAVQPSGVPALQPPIPRPLRSMARSEHQSTMLCWGIARSPGARRRSRLRASLRLA